MYVFGEVLGFVFIVAVFLGLPAYLFWNFRQARQLKKLKTEAFKPTDHPYGRPTKNRDRADRHGGE